MAMSAEAFSPVSLRYASSLEKMVQLAKDDLRYRITIAMALILLADDDSLVGEVVRGALSERGHVVGIVENGADAVRVVQLKNPALVILDCSMPEMNGIEALIRIRRCEARYRTPILMLTGRRSDADVEIAMRAGADQYLKKPFDADQLVAIVENMLARSRPADMCATRGWPGQNVAASADSRR
jgi:DNA-binding response OmpR family regulator